MADHPLRPAIDRRLGRALPYQLPNLTRADLSAINLSPNLKDGAYTVLAPVSQCYPVPQGTFPRVTHPSAALQYAEAYLLARLACVRPAASVRPEPGSNSQVCCKINRSTSLQNSRPKPKRAKPKAKKNACTIMSSQIRGKTPNPEIHGCSIKENHRHNVDPP